MELIYSPVALPGCCFICRAAQRDSYIDTGVSMDFEGAFYICHLCVDEMAVKYAYIAPDEYKDLRTQKEELESQNFQLIKRLGILEESLDALGNAGYRTDLSGNVVRVGGFSSSVDEEGRHVFERITEDVEPGEGESSESFDDEDLAGLRSGSTNSDPFDL